MYAFLLGLDSRACWGAVEAGGGGLPLAAFFAEIAGSLEDLGVA